jgi:hypothetical protein
MSMSMFEEKVAALNAAARKGPLEHQLKAMNAMLNAQKKAAGSEYQLTRQKLIELREALEEKGIMLDEAAWTQFGICLSVAAGERTAISTCLEVLQPQIFQNASMSQKPSMPKIRRVTPVLTSNQMKPAADTEAIPWWLLPELIQRPPQVKDVP